MEGQASGGKVKPKLDDEKTVGKKLKPKVPPCESQDPKGDTTLAPKRKARKRNPSQDKPDKSSNRSTTTKDERDEKPSSSNDKPKRARAPKGSKSSKSKKAEAAETKTTCAKGGEETKAAAKAKLSRKPAAYHRAKVAALKAGKDEETAYSLGREVALKCFSTFFGKEKHMVSKIK